MESFFTTSTGHKINIASVPPLLIEEVRARAMEEIEVPPVPTYPVELPDGTSLSYEHDDDSIADPATTDADRKLWAKYKAAKDEQVRHSSAKVMELFMIKGTVIPDEEITGGEWLALQQYFKIKIPNDPFALKVHYLRTELLRNVEDIYGLMSQIVEMSGIDKTILQAAKNSFRDNLRTEPDTAPATGGTEPAKPERAMAHELSVQRVGSGEVLGFDTSTVGL